MDRRRRCLKCGVNYREINNLGKWSCRQHPGVWNDGVPGIYYDKDRYDCCGNQKRFGAPLDPTGCIRADHTELASPYTEYNDVPLPPALMNAITIYKESLVDSNSARETTSMNANDSIDSIIIRRFDWKDSDRRRDSGTSVYCNKKRKR